MLMDCAEMWIVCGVVELWGMNAYGLDVSLFVLRDGSIAEVETFFFLKCAASVVIWALLVLFSENDGDEGS